MLDNVKNIFLTENKLHSKDIFNILDTILFKKFNFGDIYFQFKEIEFFLLENKIIKQSGFYQDSGFGIRVIHHNMTGFSYSTNINLKNLLKILKMSFFIIPEKIYKNYQKINKKIPFVSYYCADNPLKSIDFLKKIYLLHKIDKFSRKQDHRIIDVIINLTSEFEKFLIGSTDSSHLLGDIRPLVHLSITIIVESNGKREKGSYGGGSRSTIEYFLEKNKKGEIRSLYWAKKAIHLAVLGLSSKISPVGTFPVVLGSGWPGILLHEAVGHGLESDFIRKKTSVYTKKINKKIASSLCTVIDNGTLKNSRGSINIDDEGTPSQKTILISKGILKNFLYDKYNAFLMNSESTGNGRRESYAFLPLPRMTNTYLTSGFSTKTEMIESIDFGIYASNFNGGQVDITSGNFVFFASEAYLIQKGKICYSIKGAMFSGIGSKTMKLISMVGSDLRMDSGIGTCGKEGQQIPVCVGQPTIKIEQITVG